MVRKLTSICSVYFFIPLLKRISRELMWVLHFKCISIDKVNKGGVAISSVSNTVIQVKSFRLLLESNKYIIEAIVKVRIVNYLLI